MRYMGGISGLKQHMPLLVLVPTLLGASQCYETHVLEPQITATVERDDAIGQFTVIHPENGTRWLVCPVGAEFDEDKRICTGTPTTFSLTDAPGACPEGYRLPTIEELSSLLCGLSETQSDECPQEQFSTCAQCETCRSMFGSDTGTYPTQGEDENGAPPETVVDLESGCIIENGSDGREPYGVHCIENEYTEEMPRDGGVN